MTTGASDPQKLYQQIARAIATAIGDGRYGPGDKLPSERELADDFGVSRPTVRDAMIALEFQGLVEARQGSGVYVNALAAPAADDPAEVEVGALELIEARRLFEGEACALSAATVTDESLALLEQLVGQMARSFAPEEVERLEQAFHLAIARATGNAAIEAGVEDLWTLRQQSPACVATLRRARAHGGDAVEAHRRIVAALRQRDPKAARQAIHAHLAQVIEDLLAVAELDALQQTRQKMAEQRRELARRTQI